MPLKGEELNKYMRDYRAKKKEEREDLKAEADKVDQVHVELTDFLKTFGFESMSFKDFIEMIHDRFDKDGETMEDEIANPNIEVLYGWNLTLIVETAKPWVGNHWLLPPPSL